MADTDKLTTSDIADQTKSSTQDRNGAPKGDPTKSDSSLDDARAQLDRGGSDASASQAKPVDAPDQTRDSEPVFKPPLRPADAARTNDADAPDASGPAASTTDGADTALLDDSEAQDLRRRWTDIQTTFVDRPKDSVSQADELVAETIKRLAAGFADERDNLESVWSQGGDVSTEDLRVALQRYRSFFERLLNA